MKSLSLLIVSVAVILLAACGGRSEQLSEPEIQATVQAALYATSTAQALFANRVNEAVNATATANVALTPAPPTSTRQTIALTATPQPTLSLPTTPLPPTATPVNAVILSEEQRAALIDQAVAEAIAASEAMYTTTTTSTSNDTVAASETAAMTYYVGVSEQQVAEALALIEQYYALYSEVAAETLVTLQAIEQDLNALAANTAAMAESLEEINQTLAQGLELAQETIDQLESAAQNAQTQANEAKHKAQGWYESTLAQMQTRAQHALSVQPNAAAASPQEALTQIRSYVEAAKRTLNKDKLSPQDIFALAQQGANAKAALQKFGGANAQELSGTIDQLTRRAAKGELPQAKQELGNLERSVQSLQFNGAPLGGAKPGGISPPQPGGGSNPPLPGGGNLPKPRP